MRGSLSRRALISAVAWGVSMHLFGRKVAHGQATQASVPFSQDVAAHIARSLIAENPVLPTLEIGDPVPSYDANGAFKGYSIGFFDGGMPHAMLSLMWIATALFFSCLIPRAIETHIPF